MRLGELVGRLSTKAPVRSSPSPLRASKQPDRRSVSTRLAQVERLVAEERLHPAVDVLTEAVRMHDDPAGEVRLRDLRHQAARSSAKGVGRDTWPPPFADPFPQLSGEIPEASGAELSAATMGGAVIHHGALLVRQLLTPDQVERVLGAVDSAQVSQQNTTDGSRDRWFDPFPGRDRMRANIRDRGGTWLADSPAATAIVLDELEDCGAVRAISEYFDERPHFSLEKSTMRRTPPEEQMTGWHQDGSFLGPDVRTMNLWIALSACGGTEPAAGLEVVPHRLEELLPKDPALGNAGVSFELMDDFLAEMPAVLPTFQPGDALVFDERFLHRTATGPGLTRERYAVECWFFAPSHWTSDYTPFLV